MSNQNTPDLSFRGFLQEALPQKEGCTLAVGEEHTQTEHLRWVHENLDRLQRDYGITTIGVEQRAWLSPFFWAYKDGALARDLGGKEEAAAYLGAILLAETQKDCWRKEFIDLVVSAMDKGIDVVPYDSRLYIENAALSKALPCDASLLTQLRQEAMSEGAGRFLNFLQYIANNQREYEWISAELKQLLEKHPEYCPKVAAMDALSHEGYKKISEGKLTSDALSATLFDGMANQNGNRMTIVGSGHVDGIGYYNDEYRETNNRQVYGVFGHHLANLFDPKTLPEKQKKHMVTHVFAAGVALKNAVDEYNQKRFNEGSNSKATKGHTLYHLNLEDGAVGKMWQPKDQEDVDVVPLERKFPESSVAKAYLAAHRAAHVNPRLIPSINDLANKLQQEIHGKKQRALG